MVVVVVVVVVVVLVDRSDDYYCYCYCYYYSSTEIVAIASWQMTMDRMMRIDHNIGLLQYRVVPERDVMS